MTTTINPFAGFGGKTREIDTRTVGIPDAVLKSMDNAVAHFATRQNKKQLEVEFADAASAEEFASQLSRYAAANGVTISTLEQEDNVVRFRFAKVRANGDETESADV